MSRNRDRGLLPGAHREPATDTRETAQSPNAAITRPAASGKKRQNGKRKTERGAEAPPSAARQTASLAAVPATGLMAYCASRRPSHLPWHRRRPSAPCPRLAAGRPSLLSPGYRSPCQRPRSPCLLPVRPRPSPGPCSCLAPLLGCRRDIAPVSISSNGYARGCPPRDAPKRAVEKSSSLG